MNQVNVAVYSRAPIGDDWGVLQLTSDEVRFLRRTAELESNYFGHDPSYNVIEYVGSKDMHDISRRPQFARLVDDIRAGNIYRVFVRDFWSISRNASQLREFIALCQEHDTSVSFIDQDFDTWEDDPRIWRLFHQALAEMDEQNVGDAVTSM